MSNKRGRSIEEPNHPAWQAWLEYSGHVMGTTMGLDSSWEPFRAGYREGRHQRRDSAAYGPAMRGVIENAEVLRKIAAHVPGSVYIKAKESAGYGTNVKPREFCHGIDCEKELHVGGGGYLHHESDDGPYDVDGCSYCGRCHCAL